MGPNKDEKTRRVAQGDRNELLLPFVGSHEPFAESIVSNEPRLFPTWLCCNSGICAVDSTATFSDEWEQILEVAAEES